MTDYDTSILGASTLTLDGATTWQRLRPTTTPNPYNPKQPNKDWNHPTSITFKAALAASSSSQNTDVLDVRLTSSAVLTVPDPTIDIKAGDRITSVPDDGRTWEVTGVPSRDINAFSGWQPTTEIQLTEWKG
ncbi:hypothetical protein QP104_07345 [Alloscardovia omnicolens]|uniref:hypothetical protein n=1 Tax=Alloscardovia omnicolens TaxID=419015 RepID=UPI00255168DD|nr:hypothetical protein [Alloscardovia omnicolens]MDK6445727.1 hypothetical protein [Alloscardovia omnicolens]